MTVVFKKTVRTEEDWKRDPFCVELDQPVQIGKLVVMARTDIRLIRGNMGREMLAGMDSEMIRAGEELLAYRLTGGVRTEMVDAIMKLAVPGPHPPIGSRMERMVIAVEYAAEVKIPGKKLRTPTWIRNQLGAAFKAGVKEGRRRQEVDHQREIAK